MENKVALVTIGYTQYEVPSEMIPYLLKMRRVDHVYEGGYKYFYADDSDDGMDVKFLPIGRILPAKPGTAPADPPSAAPLVFVDGVIKAPLEDGSDGVRAARELSAEFGTFETISFLERTKS